MSTKGLMADKRVKEVTLNSAGKAATLTLADGWTFNGEAGPFNLDNVDHGHKIVKAAINPNAPGKAARAPREKAQPSGPPADPSQPYAPPPPSPAELRKIAKREDIEAHIYRPKLIYPDHEFTGWMRFSQAPKNTDLKARTIDLLGSVAKARGYDPAQAEVECPRWTVEDERAARKANDAGCPWPSVFRPGASTVNDAPIKPEPGQ